MCLNFCLTKQPFLTPPVPRGRQHENRAHLASPLRKSTNKSTQQKIRDNNRSTASEKSFLSCFLSFFAYKTIWLLSAENSCWLCKVQRMELWNKTAALLCHEEGAPCVRRCVCVCVLTAWHYANKLDLQHVSSIATEVKIFVVQRGTGECKVFAILLSPRWQQKKRKRKVELHSTC